MIDHDHGRENTTRFSHNTENVMICFILSLFTWLQTPLTIIVYSGIQVVTQTLEQIAQNVISGGEGCAEGRKRSVGNIPCIFMLAALLPQRRHLTCFYIVIPLQRQTLVPAFWTGSQGLIPCANTSNACLKNFQLRSLSVL